MSADFAQAAVGQRVPVERMRAFTSGVMHAAGVPDDRAAVIADVLVEADARGVFSHGVTRVTPYTDEIRSGLVVPDAEIKTLQERPSTAALDAGGAPGAVSAQVGIQRAIDLASDGAAGMVCVHNGRHFGPAAHWALQAVEAGCIAFVTSSGGGASGVLAFGSRTPALTNGPIAWALPAGTNYPVVADMAVGFSALGKVRVAAATGQSIPADVGVDADGNPTTDPNQLVWLNPFAGPKGFGFGIVMETLSGILAGATAAVNRTPDHLGTVGQVFAAIRVEAFRPLAEFLADMDRTIDAIHALRPAEGFDRVLVPGEPEWLKRADAFEHGIGYPSGLLDAVAETGRVYGVDPEWDA